MVQHVTLEVRREQGGECAAFWALLGFERVEPPPSLADRAAWLEHGSTQIHVMWVEDPVVLPRGHVAVVLDDWEGMLESLRAADHEPEPRRVAWGRSARTWAGARWMSARSGSSGSRVGSPGSASGPPWPASSSCGQSRPRGELAIASAHGLPGDQLGQGEGCGGYGEGDRSRRDATGKLGESPNAAVHPPGRRGWMRQMAEQESRLVVSMLRVNGQEQARRGGHTHVAAERSYAGTRAHRRQQGLRPRQRGSCNGAARGARANGV